MRYVALMRGMNVGGAGRVGMKELKALFETLGYENVSTYINSGNVIFESGKGRDGIRREIERALAGEFGFEMPTLVKTRDEMRRIAAAIPLEWQNDAEQKTDVAYLFPGFDAKETVDALQVRREYIEIHYVEGAIIWNVSRKNVNRSRLSKIIGHECYRHMTVRNVNTARHLAGEKS